MYVAAIPGRPLLVRGLQQEPATLPTPLLCSAHGLVSWMHRRLRRSGREEASWKNYKGDRIETEGQSRNALSQ